MGLIKVVSCATFILMDIDLTQLLAHARLTKADVARRLRLNKSTVTRWADNGVPADRVIDLEQATGIPRQAIRPDLYVGILPPSRAPARGAS